MQPTEQFEVDSDDVVSADDVEVCFDCEASVCASNEVVYSVDEFDAKRDSGKNHSKYSQPPSFKDAINQVKDSIQNKFQEKLNGKIVGIWPIKPTILKR